MEYLVWEAEIDDGVCVLGSIQNVPDSFELSEGISRVANFPADACYHMAKAHPNDVKLADQLENVGNNIVINNTLKTFLDTLDLSNVEFLPVSIINHKGRVASDEYFIVNPLTVVDCIDKQASDLQWGEIDKDSISGVYSLELLDDFEPTPPIFRPKHLTDVILVNEEVAEAVNAEGFSGVDFVPLDEFEQ